MSGGSYQGQYSGLGRFGRPTTMTQPAYQPPIFSPPVMAARRNFGIFGQQPTFQTAAGDSGGTANPGFGGTANPGFGGMTDNNDQSAGRGFNAGPALGLLGGLLGGPAAAFAGQQIGNQIGAFGAYGPASQASQGGKAQGGLFGTGVAPGYAGMAQNTNPDKDSGVVDGGMLGGTYGADMGYGNDIGGLGSGLGTSIGGGFGSNDIGAGYGFSSDVGATDSGGADGGGGK